MSNQPNTPGSAQEFGELITGIKNEANKKLGELMTNMLQHADEKLLEKADAADFTQEKDVFYWLKKKLGDVKADMAAEFMINIIPLLRPYTVTQAEDAAKKLEELDDELGLVGSDDMDDMVLVKNLGTEAGGKFREKISNLETRLEHLALKTPDIFAKNALSPMNICQAFDDTLIDRFEIAEKKIMFDLFKEDVADQFGGLYDLINNALIDAGILPQIKLTSKGIKRAPAPQAPPVDAPPEQPMDDMGDDYPQDAGYTGGYQGSYAPQGGTPQSQGGQAPAGGGAPPPQAPQPQGSFAPQGGAEPPPQAPQPQGGGETVGGGYAQTATPGAYGAGAPHAGTPADGGFSGAHPPPDASGNYQHQTAGMPASQVSQTISNFLGAPVQGGGANAAHSGQEVQAYPTSTAQHFGHDEIIQALSSIQAQPTISEAGELKFDAEAVKQAIMASIAKTSGGAITKRINQIAEKTIDFIELVFDAIIEDESISDTIKALLLRLQIPVIKASMLDQEFFIYDDHPARVLLDRIAEIGTGVTAHDDEVYIRLDKIVSQLISEYELDTATFQGALDNLNDYIKEREEQAHSKEEEAQKQALREHARNTVLKSLRGITAGKSLPEAVHALILKRWPTLMFNHYLDFGKENDEWVAIVGLLRDIIDSVQPIESAEDLAHLKAEKETLVERVEHYLSKAYKSKKDIRFVVGGLIETYDDMIEDANFQEEQIQAAEHTVAEQGPREKEPVKVEPAHVPKKPLPSNIMPGMWFQIYTGEGSPVRRCKLSVIIVEDEKLIFVTHDGELIAEKSFEEFTGEIDSGISKVIMGHSVFDYALNSVITKLEPARH